MADSGRPDDIAPEAGEVRPEHLPDECLRYLTGSRYCETDLLWGLAWRLFGSTEPGWARVQAICDYVHQRLAFSYGYARSTRTAIEAHEERVGVCRDFAHLAIAFCRCMNIPARYVNGYLGDIGVEPDPSPMDFSAWFEAYLGGAGMPSTPATTRRASGASSWRAAATRWMCRSCTVSARISWRASMSGPTRSPRPPSPPRRGRRPGLLSGSVRLDVRRSISARAMACCG